MVVGEEDDMANSVALGFAAVAVLLLAGAVLLLGRAGQQTRRQETEARLDRGMEPVSYTHLRAHET